ncbi:hypothetical protein ZOSMA_64G00490 [Zostera marina]|uniref:Protein kinase domain-containing protein n=1 Tax=Zostera marina TaxID=29655 RepID=A0A0K9NT72_ZOSMR|nr:hypothetical protein ZOSMA_64G00490 [Zostera marina]
MGSQLQSSEIRTTWVRGKCIGRGSFGSVNIAYDNSTGEIFAVKSVMINPHNSAVVRVLENESMIYRSIHSPYIVSYLGDDLTKDISGDVCFNLHLEYMPNGTVADAAKNGLTECEVRSYIRCLTEAVRYLHDEVGIVHGDVKGKNVLVGHTTGTAKLADFGSAKSVFSNDAHVVAQGTPLWMAPEIVRGEPNSPESDVWSLGCTVVEMITGEAPWKKLRGQSTESILLQIGSGEYVPDLPEKISEAGKNFIGKCLRRNPEERWSCQQLLDHPFLSDFVNAVVDMSPRSVFGWLDSEFETPDGIDTSTSDLSINSIDIKQRIAVIAAKNAGAVWEDDDDDCGIWEFVRGESSPAQSSSSSYTDVILEKDRTGSGWTGLRSGSRVGKLREDLLTSLICFYLLFRVSKINKHPQTTI